MSKSLPLRAPRPSTFLAGISMKQFRSSVLAGFMLATAPLFTALAQPATDSAALQAARQKWQGWAPTVQFGHQSPVDAVAFSADGRRIVSGGRGAINVWDAENGRLISTVKPAWYNGPQSVAFVSEGRQILASGDSYGAIQMWDVPDGRPVRTIERHSDLRKTRSAVSSDGKRVAIGGYDNAVNVWDVESGGQLHRLTGHTGAVQAVAYSPDGGHLLSGSDDGTIRIWDAQTGRLLRMLAGHTAAVTSVGFSPDSRYIVSGSADQTVRVWDAASGRVIRTLAERAGYVRGAAFSPDNRYIASIGNDDMLRIWDARGYAVLQTLSGVSAESMAFSPDGARLAVGGADAKIRILDVRSGEPVFAIPGNVIKPVSLAVSSDSSLILSGNEHTTPLVPMMVWDGANGRLVRVVSGHSSGVASIAMFPDDRRIATASPDKTVRVWDLRTGAQLTSFAAHERLGQSVAVSPDGTLIVSGGCDDGIKFWSTESGRLLGNIRDHKDCVNSVAFSGDGRRLISLGWDRKIRLWELNQFRLLNTFSAGDKAVSFSPDGTRIVTGGSDNMVRIVDIESGRVLQSIGGGPRQPGVGESSSIDAVAFSPSGRQVAFGTWDGKIRLAEAASGSVLSEISGHTAHVRSVRFSRDGARLFSVADDSKLMIWDAEAGRRIATIVAFDAADYAVIGEDGSYFVTPGASARLVLARGGEIVAIPDEYRRAFAVNRSFDEIASTLNFPSGRNLRRSEANPRDNMPLSSRAGNQYRDLEQALVAYDQQFTKRGEQQKTSDDRKEADEQARARAEEIRLAPICEPLRKRAMTALKAYNSPSSSAKARQTLREMTSQTTTSCPAQVTIFESNVTRIFRCTNEVVLIQLANGANLIWTKKTNTFGRGIPQKPGDLLAGITNNYHICIETTHGLRWTRGLEIEAVVREK